MHTSSHLHAGLTQRWATPIQRNVADLAASSMEPLAMPRGRPNRPQSAFRREQPKTTRYSPTSAFMTSPGRIDSLDMQRPQSAPNTTRPAPLLRKVIKFIGRPHKGVSELAAVCHRYDVNIFSPGVQGGAKLHLLIEVRCNLHDLECVEYLEGQPEKADWERIAQTICLAQPSQFSSADFKPLFCLAQTALAKMMARAGVEQHPSKPTLPEKEQPPSPTKQDRIKADATALALQQRLDKLQLEYTDQLNKYASLKGEKFYSNEEKRLTSEAQKLQEQVSQLESESEALHARLAEAQQSARDIEQESLRQQTVLQNRVRELQTRLSNRPKPVRAKAVQGAKAKARLLAAIESGDLEAAAALLAAGVAADGGLLLAACRAADVDAAALLIENGARTDCDDGSPLHEACTRRSLELIDLLLDAGAAVDQPDASGVTALRRVLLEEAAALDADAAEDRAAHAEAIRQAAEAAAEEAAAGGAGAFGSEGATEVGAAEHAQEAETPEVPPPPVLEGVAQQRQERTQMAGEIVQRLVAAGGALGFVLPNGDTPLLWAVRHSLDRCVHALLAAGEDANACGADDEVPISVALSLSPPRLDMAILLSSFGASLAALPKGVTRADLKKLREASDGAKALIEAAGAGQVSKLQRTLDKGAAVNCRSAEGDTPLLAACRTAQVGVLPTLVKAGAKLNVFDGEGNSPLHLALASPPLLAFLLGEVSASDGKVELDARDREGRTALHIAIAQLRIPLVKTLLRAGASVDIQDERGFSPLHCLCALDDSAIDSAALALSEANGGDLALTPALVDAVAVTAAGGGRPPSTTHVRQIVGAHRALPADHEAAGALPTGPSQRVRLLFDILKKAGAAEKAALSEALPPLQLAMQAERLELVELMLQNKRLFVDPLLARGGDSPVLWATRTRQTEALRKMLELGLDATAVGANGATPMHVCDDDDVAVLLADFGGRLDAKDTAGIDAGTALKNNIRMRMLPWVREEAEKERLEQEAARAAAAKEQEEAAAAPGTGEDVSEGHEAEGKAQHGGDEPSDGSVPATEGEPTDEAEAAKTPAKPRVLTDDEKALASDVEKQIAETIKRVSQAAVMCKSLHEAVEKKDQPKAKLALKKGAQMHSRGGALLLTPLQTAASKGDLKMVQMLLSQPNGKDCVDATDARGYSALHLACKGNHATVAKELAISAKADVHIRDCNGKTPIQLASSAELKQMLRDSRLLPPPKK